MLDGELPGSISLSLPHFPWCHTTDTVSEEPGGPGQQQRGAGITLPAPAGSSKETAPGRGPAPGGELLSERCSGAELICERSAQRELSLFLCSQVKRAPLST